MKFVILPSGGGLGAKKIALADIGGDTYATGGIDVKAANYRILGVFCNKYLAEFASGKVKLFKDAETEAGAGAIPAGTQLFLILGI